MKSIAAVIMAGVIGLAVTGVAGFTMVPWLRKLKFGQTILDIGPKWHKSKQGTPTMGGLMMVIGVASALVVTVITDKIMGGDIVASGSMVATEQYTKLWSGFIMALSFGLIGFADDYIKAVMHRNLGLTIKQKTVAQLAVAFVYLLSISKGMGGLTYMFIPFVGTVHMNLYYWFFGIVIIYAAVNAVNFTDGIDGLCSSATLITSLTLGVVAALKGFFGFSMMSSALAGACLGFFLWNKNPAKVFMGDTGSLFLGGMLVAIAYGINCPLILLPAGLVFVIEGASDVLQIVYYRISGGKRIFKMAPIHHHFEMCGWSEKKIVAVFGVVNILGGAAAYALMKSGGYFG